LLVRTALVVTLLGLSGASVLADDGAAVEVQLRDGLATPTHFHVSGRVLRLDRRALVREKLTRMLGQPGRMLDAMDTDDAESIHVRIAVDGTTYSATTDDDGTFDLDVEGLRTALPVGVLPIKVTLASPGVVLQRGGEGVLHVFAERGVLVVSDVDDTIVQTFVTEKRRAVKQVLTKGEDTLDAVPGAPAAYQHARAAGAAGFVYLSGSPQNLYPRVHGYLAHLQIPAGPLLLKNVGGDELLVQRAYKTQRLVWLLTMFPRLGLLLVGDDGEKDPEIYTELQRRFPARRIGIVIRNTTGAAVTSPRFAGLMVVPDYTADPMVLASQVQILSTQ